jgi:hypothetical protein
MVTTQLEPFTATIAANGTSNLNINQSLSSLPPHPVNFGVPIRLNGEAKMGSIRVDPLDPTSNLKIFLDADDRFVANMGDSIQFPGTAISWITNM